MGGRNFFDNFFQNNQKLQNIVHFFLHNSLKSYFTFPQFSDFSPLVWWHPHTTVSLEFASLVEWKRVDLCFARDYETFLYWSSRRRNSNDLEIA